MNEVGWEGDFSEPILLVARIIDLCLCYTVAFGRRLQPRIRHLMSLSESQGHTVRSESTMNHSASLSEKTAWSADMLRGPGVGAALIALAMLSVFWEFISRQVRWAVEEQADWGHTLLIPFIAGYFVYLQREKLLAKPFHTVWVGLLPMILGVGIYIFCSLSTSFHHHNLMSVGIALTLFGLALLFCGWRSMLILWFPLLYLVVFGQTISNRFMDLVTNKMQDITAWGSDILLSFGLDVERKGNTLYIYGDAPEPHPLNIAEACSGMRMLMAFLALGVAMSYTGFRHVWQRILLVMFAIPTSIFVNVLRVCTLGLLSLMDTNFAAGDFHSFIGLLWLIPAFLIYLSLMWLIRHLVIEGKDPQEAPSGPLNAGASGAKRGFDHQAKWALLATCITLIGSGLGFRMAVNSLNVYLKKEPVALREAFATIPGALGSWEAQIISTGRDKGNIDATMDEAMVEALGTDKYLSRWYTRDVGKHTEGIGLHIAYYTGMIDAVPHVADRCMVAAGYLKQGNPLNMPIDIGQHNWDRELNVLNRATGKPYPLIMVPHRITRSIQRLHPPIEDFKFRVSEFLVPDNPDIKVFAGYLFIANGRTTPSPEAIRALAYDQTDKYSYYCKVQLTWLADEDATPDDFIETVEDFLRPLMPEIVRCLPDWPEIERRDMPSENS